MNLKSPTDPDLSYYYFGFYRVLKRYRFMTMLGWSGVFFGVASLGVGWDFGRPHGLVDIAMSGFVVILGLALVQQSVASLESYIAVPFRARQASEMTDEPEGAVLDSITLMKEIELGGWQEAYAAIHKLKEMGTLYTLPPLP